MQPFAAWLDDSTRRLLNSRQRRLALLLLLVVLPFGSFFSRALIALVSLRIGARQGLEMLIVALVSTLAWTLYMSDIPVETAMPMVLVANLPCFAAALLLRNTRSWQLTAGGFFLMACLCSFLVQFAYPGLLSGAAWQQLTTSLSDMVQLKSLLNENVAGHLLNQDFLSHFVMSAIILAAVIANLLPLLIARMMQARCYNPGGFRVEWFNFRCGKLSLALFVLLLLAEYAQMLWAIDILPLLFLYFFISGLVLVQLLAKRMHAYFMLFLMIIVLLTNPFLVFSLLVLAAMLDSLIDFRSYLPVKAV